ncbi:flagellar assembly protein FliW [Candidatus Arthromitus sp. SFB-rat-Yit]|uniref:flagellar assembly protein FliW n=1 Tax=Candidatus Arthromitus sp. SFB-rat-Yit TaxID=1041504 RepID=UPI000227A5D7|nr:flagellar assembly protein FliW [Candidatus Arthromitus sp. SFB-rat-Yit]BAK81041.1 flagellar assembly factor FliW [Candidatus Arthromitus sp. SFB-rat-Yit]
MGEQMVLKNGSVVFEKGLPGFDGLKNFELVALEQVGFFNLSSSEQENISLLLIDPYIYFPNYEIEIDDSTTERLNIKDASDVLVLSVVTLNDDVEKITLNLRAPIIVNLTTGKCEQVILDREDYLVRQSLVVKRG